jgi:hypothetical protein
MGSPALSFLSVKVLSRVFRGKFVSGLKQAYRNDELCLPGPLKPLQQEKAFRSLLRTLFRQDWVVYAKPPFGGPDHVLHYLARYTHRVAISNHRLVNFAEGKVTFRWKDYSTKGKQRLMTITAEEFLRRFLLHILPRGFQRIRFFGFLANRRRASTLPVCRRLLEVSQASCSDEQPAQSADSHDHQNRLCPLCGGPMLLVERLTEQQLARELSLMTAIPNTS